MNEKNQQGDLFAYHPKEKPAADLAGMARSPDHHTSIEAAQAVKEGLSSLQEQVQDMFANGAELTDEDLETHPYFSKYAYSTVRKRRTELVAKGVLVECGTRTNTHGRTMKVWRLA